MKANGATTGDLTAPVGHHHYHHFAPGWATDLVHPSRRRRGRDAGEADRERVREWRERQQDRRQRIQQTIARRGLETHIQPIIDLRSGRQVGAEALSRFAGSPVRAPDQWFADAASVGLAVELELLALQIALEQLPLLPGHVYLSLNVSAATIMSDGLASALAGAPPERIVLELTEVVPAEDFPAFEQRITDIRAEGIRLAVDDAGSSDSSFRRLLQLRPDIIKLDIGLSRGIDADPARRSFGRALLNFGLDSCGAEFVAEGIETQAELDSLRSLGCAAGQGYFLGRPGPLTMRYLEPFVPKAAERATAPARRDG